MISHLIVGANITVSANITLGQTESLEVHHTASAGIALCTCTAGEDGFEGLSQGRRLY